MMLIQCVCIEEEGEEEEEEEEEEVDEGGYGIKAGPWA